LSLLVVEVLVGIMAAVVEREVLEQEQGLVLPQEQPTQSQ